MDLLKDRIIFIVIAAIFIIALIIAKENTQWEGFQDYALVWALLCVGLAKFLAIKLKPIIFKDKK